MNGEHNADVQGGEVFILGAGFTRAFLSRTPLMLDRFCVEEWLQKYEHFPYANDLIRSHLVTGEPLVIDIERLMTRLDALMPHDFLLGVENDLHLLYSDVKRCLLTKIREAKGGWTDKETLARLAQHCVDNGLHCITFNYDDMFDEALWSVKSVLSVPSAGFRYWHPDGGYGFFCRPSETCLRDTTASMDETSMRLFKLHGSVNWRAKLGSRRPFPLDAVVHHEDWLPRIETGEPPEAAMMSRIANHLEPEPFIVPPILAKSALVEEPTLRYVWSQAYQVLMRAPKVTFVGYSFPLTDIASRWLFSEALRHRPEIVVVNMKSTEVERRELRNIYRQAFPAHPGLKFDFGGALAWASRIAPPP